MLDAGADDYVVKPYSAEHLEARLRGAEGHADAGHQGVVLDPNPMMDLVAVLQTPEDRDGVVQGFAAGQNRTQQIESDTTGGGNGG